MMSFDPFTAVLGVLLILAIGYIVYVKRKEGKQPGEDAIDAAGALLVSAVRRHLKESTQAAVPDQLRGALISGTPLPIQPAAAAPVPAPAAATAPPEWPRIISVGGVHVMAYAPINPAWVPPMTARIFGGTGHYVFDPSEPKGARSPNGYPLINGRVFNGETTYASEAEMAHSMAVAAERAAQKPAQDADFLPQP